MIDFPMFDLSDPKLSKSADSLESALAQLSKGAAPFAALDSSVGADSLLASPSVSASMDFGSGFDEWLAKDLQFGTLPGDDSAASSLTSSPYSPLVDSPELGFESLSALLGGPPLFDMNLGFSDASSPESVPAPVAPAPVVAAAPAPAAKAFPSALTSAAVKQAAAALNIPYSAQLEQAVMAQARAQVLSQVVSVPALPVNSTPAMIIPKSEPLDQSVVVSSPSKPASVAKSPAKKRALTPEDEPEEVVLKRAKNTDAARRSRLKKLLRLESLESKVADLESTNNRLTMKVAILETEKNGHLVREAEQSARIAQLEAKLAEAHAALTGRA